jgi:hypothetical protein
MPQAFENAAVASSHWLDYKKGGKCCHFSRLLNCGIHFGFLKSSNSPGERSKKSAPTFLRRQANSSPSPSARSSSNLPRLKQGSFQTALSPPMRSAPERKRSELGLGGFFRSNPICLRNTREKSPSLLIMIVPVVLSSLFQRLHSVMFCGS